MAYEDVPDKIPERLTDLIEELYPEGTAVAIVSEHLDGSATLAIAGIYPTDQEIVAALQHGLDAWQSEET